MLHWEKCYRGRNVTGRNVTGRIVTGRIVLGRNVIHPPDSHPELIAENSFILTCYVMKAKEHDQTG